MNPMKLYALFYYSEEYADYSLICIYSTFEKAKEQMIKDFEDDMKIEKDNSGDGDIREILPEDIERNDTPDKFCLCRYSYKTKGEKYGVGYCIKEYELDNQHYEEHN